MRTYSSFGALIVLIASCGPALAWGDVGHEVVCEIAYRELNPQARNRLASLITLDSQFRTFAKSCTWPDHPHIRGVEHYVNVPRSAIKIESSKPCPMGNECVVKAIAKDMAHLAEESNETEQLKLAKSLGHWVGDVHQPLHVSFEDDRGGNSINVDWPCRGDLHSVWDTCIIANKIGDVPRDIAIELRAEITDEDRAKWVPGKIDLAAIIGWANESLAITLKPNVQYCVQKSGECWYAANQKTYPGGQRKNVDVNDAYLTEHAPTVRERLKMAGVRLAAVLNTALGEVTTAEMPSVTSLRASTERGRAPMAMVAVSADQWQALLFRLDRLEGALQSVTQELRSLRTDRQPARP
jgi:nuclease S1